MEEKRTRETFRKTEKLCSKKAIDSLFENGSVFYANPFKVLYHIEEQPEEPGPKVLISIPKKYIRLSADRNRMKRLVRESYRRLKYRIHTPVEESKSGLSLAIIYTGKKVISFQEVNLALEQIISKLELIIEKESKSRNTKGKD